MLARALGGTGDKSVGGGSGGGRARRRRRRLGRPVASRSPRAARRSRRALDKAALSGGDAPVQVGDGTVVPGAAGFASDAARNAIPPGAPRRPDPARRRRARGGRPVRPQACPRSPARLTRRRRGRRGRAPIAARFAAPARPRRAGARRRDRAAARRDRVRRRRRPAAGAHDVRRGRRSCCSAPALRARRCSSRSARAERLHGGLTLTAVALLAAYTAISIIVVARAVGLLDRGEPDVLLPRRVRRDDGARAARARAAGRRSCTGSRSPASSSAAGRC